jgi:hypothetical protein
MLAIDNNNNINNNNEKNIENSKVFIDDDDDEIFEEKNKQLLNEATDELRSILNSKIKNLPLVLENFSPLCSELRNTSLHCPFPHLVVQQHQQNLKNDIKLMQLFAGFFFYVLILFFISFF